MDTAIDDLIAAASDLKTTWDAFVAAMPDRDSGAPIAQILLHQLDSPAEPYQGKYQNQARGPQRVR